MSDINIIPDGMIAFLAAAALSLLLLIGIVVCSVYGWTKARRRAERFTHQGIFPHLAGMLLSLICSIAVILFIFLTEWMPVLPRSLNRWLDNWIWLWVAVILLLWPVTAYIWKKRLPYKGRIT
jgi:hypothetical protein